MNDQKYRMVKLMYLRVSGVITDKQMQELQIWLETVPEHRALFDDIKRGKELSSKYKAYQKIDHRAALQHFENRVQRKALKMREWLKYAALLLLPLGLALYLFLNPSTEQAKSSVVVTIVPGEAKATLFLSDGKQVSLKKDMVQEITVRQGINVKSSRGGVVYQETSKGADILQYNILATPRGGEFTITLSDGSVVYLNSATRLKYPVVFDAEKREVSLSGEAYFEVSKDADRPFYVIADGIRIRVYGTSFNVNTRDERRVRTVLLTGSLGVIADGNPKEYLITPSQLMEYDRTRSSVEIRNVDVEPHVAWKDGYFVFEEESLDRIMNTLSLWYDVDIFYVNERLKELHFTGHMKRYDQIDHILKAIGSAVGVTFSVKDKSIRIAE